MKGDDYLVFRERPSSTGKTQIVDILSRSSRAKLGEIRWLGRWRQYCFFPSAETVWSVGCLAEISGHVLILTPGKIRL